MELNIAQLLETVGASATFAILFYYVMNKMLNDYAARAKSDDTFQAKQLQTFSETISAMRLDFGRAVDAFTAQSNRMTDERERDHAYRDALRKGIETSLQRNNETLQAQVETLSKQTEALNRMTTTVSEFKEVSVKNVTTLIGIKSRLDEISSGLASLQSDYSKNASDTSDEIKEAHTLLGKIEGAITALNKQINQVATLTIQSIEHDTKEQPDNG